MHACYDYGTSGACTSKKVLELASLAKAKNKDLSQLLDNVEEFDESMALHYLV